MPRPYGIRRAFRLPHISNIGVGAGHAQPAIIRRGCTRPSGCDSPPNNPIHSRPGTDPEPQNPSSPQSPDVDGATAYPAKTQFAAIWDCAAAGPASDKSG